MAENKKTYTENSIESLSPLGQNVSIHLFVFSLFIEK
jgi:hypothetical protein